MPMALNTYRICFPFMRATHRSLPKSYSDLISINNSNGKNTNSFPFPEPAKTFIKSKSPNNLFGIFRVQGILDSKLSLVSRYARGCPASISNFLHFHHRIFTLRRKRRTRSCSVDDTCGILSETEHM